MKPLSRIPSPLGLVTTLTGLIIILTPNWILPVCEGLLELVNGRQIPMRCFWTARAEMVLGGLVMIAGLFVAFTRSADSRRRLNFQTAFLGLAVILTPLYFIPTCNNPDMACNVGTKPALVLLGGLTLLLGLFGARAAGGIQRAAGPTPLS